MLERMLNTVGAQMRGKRQALLGRDRLLWRQEPRMSAWADTPGVTGELLREVAVWVDSAELACLSCTPAGPSL